MIKYFQTICRQQPTNCLSVFDHFVGMALKGLSLFENDHKMQDVYLKTIEIIFSCGTCFMELDGCYMNE